MHSAPGTHLLALSAERGQTVGEQPLVRGYYQIMSHSEGKNCAEHRTASRMLVCYLLQLRRLYEYSAMQNRFAGMNPN